MAAGWFSGVLRTLLGRWGAAPVTLTGYPYRLTGADESDPALEGVDDSDARLTGADESAARLESDMVPDDRTGIIDAGITWQAGASMRPTLTVDDGLTLPAGRSLSSWDSYVLTIREDPLWPRTGADITAPVNPAADGWETTLTADGTVVSSSVSFPLTVPSSAGKKRYVFDIWGIGGVGDYPLVRSTYLTVTGSAK